MTIALIAFLGGLFTYHSLQDYFTQRGLARTQDVAQENHDLICRLDLLFGLDRPLTAKQVGQLRPSQRQALKQIIAACPELQRKEKP